MISLNFCHYPKAVIKNVGNFYSEFYYFVIFEKKYSDLADCFRVTSFVLFFVVVVFLHQS